MQRKNRHEVFPRGQFQPGYGKRVIRLDGQKKFDRICLKQSEEQKMRIDKTFRSNRF